jgi:biotin carboxyl carrier protein
MIFDVTIEGQKHRLELDRGGNGGWHCKLDGRDIRLDAVLARRDVLSLLVHGKAYEIKRERTTTDTHLWVGPVRYSAEVSDPRSLRSRKASADLDHGPIKLVAPMPGKVVRVLAAEKAEVDAGQGVLVIEAMKMQNELKSPKKGIIQKIMASEGAAVNAGDVLAVVE